MIRSRERLLSSFYLAATDTKPDQARSGVSVYTLCRAGLSSAVQCGRFGFHSGRSFKQSSIVLDIRSKHGTPPLLAVWLPVLLLLLLLLHLIERSEHRMYSYNGNWIGRRSGHIAGASPASKGVTVVYSIYAREDSDGKKAVSYSAVLCPLAWVFVRRRCRYRLLVCFCCSGQRI